MRCAAQHALQQCGGVVERWQTGLYRDDVFRDLAPLGLWSLLVKWVADVKSCPCCSVLWFAITMVMEVDVNSIMVMVMVIMATPAMQ